MPILQSVQKNLQNDDPIVQIRVGLPKVLRNFLEKEKKQIKKPIECNALIDTGASLSCISLNIRKQLQLNATDFATMLTAGQPHQTQMYDVYIDFLNTFHQPITFDPIRVMEAPLIGQTIDFLIGRDILSQMNFIYTGFANTILLSI